MDFEFDAKKSAKNKLKHGIDFMEAQKLWKDITALELPARSESLWTPPVDKNKREYSEDFRQFVARESTLCKK